MLLVKKGKCQSESGTTKLASAGCPTMKEIIFIESHVQVPDSRL
jgi:hypothetical protein